MSNNLLIFLIIFIFILCCAGIISTTPKNLLDKIIYDYEQRTRVEIRELERIASQILSETAKLELDCAADALKQKLEKEAKNEI